MPPWSWNQATRIRPPQRDTCTFTPSRKLIYNLERHCHVAGGHDRSVAKALDSTPLPIRNSIRIRILTSEFLRQGRRNPFYVCGRERRFPHVRIAPGALSRWGTNRSPHPASARELPGTFAEKLEDLILHLRGFGPKLNQMTSSIDAMEYCSGNASGHHFGP